jgi:hypothetical protein
MIGTLDDQYLTWLYANVASTRERRQSHTYWTLFQQLYEKEYIWVLSGDRNRTNDGRELRQEFVHSQVNLYADDDWINLGCSFLELIMGLSRRMAFYLDGTPAKWFWLLLDNLRLLSCTDNSEYDQNYVDALLDRVIWRQYSETGQGGLFPLESPTEDQRDVELWTQLNQYVLERM